MFPIVAALALFLLAMLSVWALLESRAPVWLSGVVGACIVAVLLVAIVMAVFAAPIFTAP